MARDFFIYFGVSCWMFFVVSYKFKLPYNEKKFKLVMVVLALLVTLSTVFLGAYKSILFYMIAITACCLGVGIGYSILKLFTKKIPSTKNK